MLFLVRMDVAFPETMTSANRLELQQQEKRYSVELQRTGTICGIWRVVGEYANYSMFDVPNNNKLHDVLSGFPMFDYMDIRVFPLAKHPNAIE